MESNKKKPAVASLAVWGSLGAIGSFLALFTKLQEFITNLPPDLVPDTIGFFTITVVGVVSAFTALIGRWKAALEIGGIFKAK